MDEGTGHPVMHTRPAAEQSPRRSGLERRTVLLGLAGGVLTLGAGVAVRSSQAPAHPAEQEALEAARALLESPAPALESVLSRLPAPSHPDPEALPALVQWLPSLHPDTPGPGLKVFNCQAGAQRLERHLQAGQTLRPQGRLGEAVLEATPGEPSLKALPWAPIFQRSPAPCRQAPEGLRQTTRCKALFFLDDSSEQQPVFGNKARKYEWLLPSYAAAGVQRLRVIGSFGSNQVLQLALANQVAAIRPGGGALKASLELSLYPQPWSPAVAAKLKLARALSNHLTLEANENAVALAVLSGAWEEQRALLAGAPCTRAVVPPGGSNALTVLGHLDALVELALAMRARQSALPEPPDLLVVALGSGATALGLLLGIRLLGWKTRVLAVASADRGTLARLVANRQPTLPFAEGTLRALAARTLHWLEETGFPAPFGPLETLLSPLEVDADAWNPGYGVLSSPARAQVEDAAAQGLPLDPTFTGKAWSGLLKRAEAGQLRGQSVLFWNTFNRFPYERLLEP